MRILIVLLCILCGAGSGHAQNQGSSNNNGRGDTLLLSVYNSGQKFRLLSADFGTKITGQDVVGDLVMAYDTVIRFVRIPVDTSTRTYYKIVTDRDCNKRFTNVKDKIVLLDYNPACDPTLLCLNAQKGGAKVVILIHFKDNRDSIRLKTGVYKDSIRIPCFSVRKSMGGLLTSMLPSQAGIQRAKDIPPGTQGLTAPNPTALNEQATKDSTTTGITSTDSFVN